MFANMPMTVAILLLAVALFGMKAVLARKARTHTETHAQLEPISFPAPFSNRDFCKKIYG